MQAKLYQFDQALRNEIVSDDPNLHVLNGEY